MIWRRRSPPSWFVPALPGLSGNLAVGSCLCLLLAIPNCFLLLMRTSGFVCSPACCLGDRAAPRELCRTLHHCWNHSHCSGRVVVDPNSRSCDSCDDYCDYCRPVTGAKGPTCLKNPDVGARSPIFRGLDLLSRLKSQD